MPTGETGARRKGGQATLPRNNSCRLLLTVNFGVVALADTNILIAELPRTGIALDRFDVLNIL